MKVDIPNRTFEFAKCIVKLCQRYGRENVLSKSITNQLLRAGTSIGANVEEGQGAQSKADFIHKHSIACKEARETHYWLRLIWETELDNSTELASLIPECNELIAILTSITKNAQKPAN